VLLGDDNYLEISLKRKIIELTNIELTGSQRCNDQNTFIYRSHFDANKLADDHQSSIAKKIGALDDVPIIRRNPFDSIVDILEKKYRGNIFDIEIDNSDQNNVSTFFLFFVPSLPLF
jgi:hypothetical protein